MSTRRIRHQKLKLLRILIRYVFIVGVFRDFVNVEIVLDIVKFCARNNLLGRNIK